MDGALFWSVAMVGIGGALVVAASRSGRAATDIRPYFEDVRIDAGPSDEFSQRLAQPFHERVLQSLVTRSADRLRRFLPRGYLAGVDHRLMKSGRASGRTAEEFVIRQAAAAGGLALAAALGVLIVQPPARVAVPSLVLLPTVGVMLPAARLNRKVAERQEAILRDLPDTLDLLAISVEAGLGFEGALSVVCQHFSSPLAEEFALTLREMELGSNRREAFQNLKRRTEVPELSSFILALLQADALGIPVGRVLKTQAVEMRNMRRSWAREKAAKLPVKILFPLVLFIFPPIFVVTLGPAAGSISGGLG
jgi:tight adherence protein C